MATRTLTIKTRMTGAPATIKNIKKIDDGLQGIATGATEVAKAMEGIEVPASAVAVSNELAKSMEALLKASKRAQQQLAGMSSAAKAAGQQGTKSIGSLSKGIVTLNQGLELAAKGFQLLKVGVGALAFPAQLAVDWEFGIAKIRAVATGLPSDFGNALEDLASKVPQTQAQLLKAAEDLARAGVEGGKIVPQLKVASRLAVAAGSDLETASSTIRLASTVWEDFGINAEKAGDILFEVTRQAPIGLADLQQNLGKIATLAAELNIPLEEATSSIAALAKAGVDVESATTQIKGLNSALISIDGASKRSRAGLAEAFGSFEEAKRQIGPAAIAADGFTVVMQRLAKATGGNIPLLRQILSNIRAFSGGLVLSKKNAADLSSILQNVNNSAGSVAKGFDIMGNTVQGSIQRFRASFEGAALKIGNALMPAIIEQFARLEVWWKQNGPEIVESAKEIATELAQWVSDDFIPQFMSLLGDIKRWFDSNGQNILQLIKSITTSLAEMIGLTARAFAAFSTDRVEMQVNATTDAVRDFNAGLKITKDRLAGLSLGELAKRQAVVRDRIAETNAAIEETKKRYKQLEPHQDEQKRAAMAELVMLEKRANGWFELNQAIATNFALKSAGPLSEQEQQVSDFFGVIGRGAASAAGALVELDRVASNPQALAGMGKVGGRVGSRAGKKAGKSWMDGFLKEVKSARFAEDLADALKIDGRANPMSALFPEESLSFDDVLQNTMSGFGAVFDPVLNGAAESASAFKGVADSVGDSITQNADKAKKAWGEFKDQAAADQAYFEETTESVNRAIGQMGDDLARAAVDALFFGESFEKGINQAMQAVFRQAAVETLKELALGFASIALGPIGGASAAAHFKSAAVWGALAAGSGLAAAATGGLGGGATATGGGGGGAAAPTATPRPREREPVTESGPQTIEIHFGGTMPLATKDDIGRAMVEVLDEYGRRRGRARADMAAFRR